MGEDLIKRKNDRFIRQRDAYFVALVEPDLFSALAPVTTSTVYASVLDAMPANDSDLWTPEVSAGAPIRFYSGDQPVVEVVGAAAEHLAREYGETGAPLVARVVESDAEEGIVRLHVRSAQ